eukprot:scaffold69706_cov63-Attheya_sp.AAC.1
MQGRAGVPLAIVVDGTVGNGDSTNTSDCGTGQCHGADNATRDVETDNSRDGCGGSVRAELEA